MVVSAVCGAVFVGQSRGNNRVMESWIAYLSRGQKHLPCDTESDTGHQSDKARQDPAARPSTASTCLTHLHHVHSNKCAQYGGISVHHASRREECGA